MSSKNVSVDHDNEYEIDDLGNDANAGNISLYEAIQAQGAGAQRDVNRALARHRQENRSEELADRRSSKKGKNLRKFREND